GGTQVIAASLANPECSLESLNLRGCNIEDEGAATLAGGLRNNQRLTRMSLQNNNITKRGWNAFSPILCDTSSINATYNSNHTLQDLGYYGIKIPQDIKMMLRLNRDMNKSRVAANKILQAHRHLDMRPLFGRELGLLPYVVAWLEHFAKSRPDLKLSSIFEFVRAMPTTKANGVKSKLNSLQSSFTAMVNFRPDTATCSFDRRPPFRADDPPPGDKHESFAGAAGSGTCLLVPLARSSREPPPHRCARTRRVSLVGVVRKVASRDCQSTNDALAVRLPGPSQREGYNTAHPLLAPRSSFVPDALVPGPPLPGDDATPVGMPSPRFCSDPGNLQSP
ncbi:hypothetical protein THAOC_25128, partial [Thalassiosira oceanica]